MKNRFGFVSARCEERRLLFVEKGILLFRINGKVVKKGAEYVPLQYMERSDMLDEIYKRLECVFLRWSSEDKIDQTRGTEGVGRKQGLPCCERTDCSRETQNH